MRALLIILLACLGLDLSAAPSVPILFFKRPVTGSGGGVDSTVWTNAVFNLKQDANGNDSTANALNFTNSGGNYSFAGKIGNSFQVGGTPFESCPSSSLMDAYNGGTVFSITGWVKRNGAPGSVDYICSRGNYPTNFQFGVNVDTSGRINFLLGDSIATVRASTGAWTDNAWHFFACVYDGSGTGNTGKAKVYIDSTNYTENVSGTVPSSIGAITASWEISCLINAGSRGTYGYENMDETTLWNIALSQAQINYLYNANVGKAYNTWLFDRKRMRWLVIK